MSKRVAVLVSVLIKSRVVLSVLLSLLGMSLVASAASINITIPSGTVRLQTSTGTVLANGSNTLAAGTYTVYANDNSDGGNCGQFTVNGSGNVSVVGGAPGMSATGLDNNLTFNVATLTVARGTYSGSMYWPWISAATYSDVTTKVPLGMSNMQLWWGYIDSSHLFTVSTDASGNASVVSPAAGIYPFSVSGGTVTFNANSPAVNFTSDAVGYVLNYVSGYVGSTNITYHMMPGAWTYGGPGFGSFNGGSFSPTGFTIALDPRGQTPVTSNYSVGGHYVTATFPAGVAPEPATLALVALGLVGVCFSRKA